MASRMHADQIPVGVETVRALLAAQFAHWAELPIERVDSSGTVNAMFRLGDDKVVRLPFLAHGAPGIDHEAAWLPRLAPHLSALVPTVSVPTVLEVGRPGAGYPFTWLILDWLGGEHPTPGDEQLSPELALDLARFIDALRAIDTAGAPVGYRGGSFRGLDDSVRGCLAQIGDLLDVPVLTEVWEEAMAASQWNRQPVWVHCDLLAANLLVADGRLRGVLDFATSGIGDPACDLMPAWSVLTADTRDRFRDAVAADDATWSRGKGWMLAQAAIALPYYRHTNRMMADNSLRALRELTNERV
jgi:aminoglycoside phosphotransferase (APT) family kinase protein